MASLIKAYGISDIGLVREKNEDSWGCVPEKGFYILCDGMGGHRGGEVAAQLAVDLLTRYARAHLPNPQEMVDPLEVEELLEQGILEANEQIFELSQTQRALQGMGTTLCCIYFSPAGVIYAHVGDSRIYRLTSDELIQLTEDHSLLAELLATGQLSAEEAEDFVYKHIVTRAVGTAQQVQPSVGREPFEVDACYLMCSDGLTDLVSDQTIFNVLSQHPEPEQGLQALVHAAYEAGGMDNVTIVLMQSAHAFDLS